MKKILALIIFIVFLLSIFFLIRFIKSHIVTEEASFDGKSLISLPYLASSGKTDKSRVGVIKHERNLASPGYNLFCSRQYQEAYLMDMEGKIVHIWSYPNKPKDLNAWNRNHNTHPLQMKNCWEFCSIDEKGNLIVIRKFKEVLHLDWNSNLIWKTPLEAHHDISMSNQQTFYTIVKEVKKHRNLLIRFPYIAELSLEGKLLNTWSTYDNLSKIKKAFNAVSFLDTLLDNGIFEPMITYKNAPISKTNIPVYDYFHANTLGVIKSNKNENDYRFKPGNLLTCFRNVDQIATLNPTTKNILWAWGENILEWPHHPTMLKNGNILIFDNGVVRKFSKIIELNPISEKIIWEYTAPEPKTFYSSHKGSSQRLPNGNTLICNGQNGHAFEVTTDKQTVWDFYIPVINKKGHRATIYRMIRYPKNIIDNFLQNNIKKND